MFGFGVSRQRGFEMTYPSPAFMRLQMFPRVKGSVCRVAGLRLKYGAPGSEPEC